MRAASCCIFRCSPPTGTISKTRKHWSTRACAPARQVVRPFVYQAVSASPADLQACSRIFAANLFPPQEAPAITPAQPRQESASAMSPAEFREQATAYLMAGLYELHDNSRFEIIAIDNGGGDGSAMRRRLEAAFDRILYINQLSDSEAADRIRAEEIDILVNLNGYFGAPRMGIFARRPAPIQVNYLGFPATLGAPYIDYIIADQVVIPEGEQHFYDEQVVWLPHSYQVNDSKRAIAKDVPEPRRAGPARKRLCVLQFQPELQADAGHFRLLDADAEAGGSERALAAESQAALRSQSGEGKPNGMAWTPAAFALRPPCRWISIWRG